MSNIFRHSILFTSARWFFDYDLGAVLCILSLLYGHAVVSVSFTYQYPTYVHCGFGRNLYLCFEVLPAMSLFCSLELL